MDVCGIVNDLRGGVGRQLVADDRLMVASQKSGGRLMRFDLHDLGWA
jgi:hypothetical protein